MTISLIASAAILALGALAIALLLARRAPEAPVPAPPIEEPAPPETEDVMHGALNLYLTAPERLPSGAARAELTLVKAALARGDGTERTFFEGARRLMLQEGVTEKILSERVPNGRWTRLKLTFSPVADLAYADGRPAAAAILERREATLSFEAEIPVSRTLALFARTPLESDSGDAAGTPVLNLVPDPRPAERYVFGGFLLDPRDRGEIIVVPSPTLASVVKEDLGFDIGRQETGSTGFVPADAAPASPTP
jgi:hypothetical protein